MASLAEVAARDPADIRNMFTAAGTTVENGATVGLYKVRFFNSAGVAEYVTVDTELPSGGAYYDQAPTASCGWPWPRRLTPRPTAQASSPPATRAATLTPP